LSSTWSPGLARLYDQAAGFHLSWPAVEICGAEIVVFGATALSQGAPPRSLQHAIRLTPSAPPTFKSLFASFSSEKEESSLPFEFASSPRATPKRAPSVLPP
jgi:hypothetical protein